MKITVLITYNRKALKSNFIITWKNRKSLEKILDKEILKFTKLYDEAKSFCDNIQKQFDDFYKECEIKYWKLQINYSFEDNSYVSPTFFAIPFTEKYKIYKEDMKKLRGLEINSYKESDILNKKRKDIVENSIVEVGNLLIKKWFLLVNKFYDVNKDTDETLFIK